MIWGKEKNKMNADLVPENEEEEKLARRLENIRSSAELQSFLLQLKSEIETLGILHFMSRVKKTGSAIRKFRKGEYRTASELDDLCGIMIVTEDLEQLYRASELMKRLFAQNRSIDLNNDTKYVGAAPLSYLIQSEMSFSDIEETVPVEIRIQEKTRFITIESLYYTLYKNDTMQGPEKWALNEVMMQIMRRQAQLDETDCDEETRGRVRTEIQSIVSENIELLEKNREVVYEAWKEYARVRYEYTHNIEMEASSLLNPSILTQLNDIISEEFDKAYQRFKKEREEVEGGFPLEPEVEKAIQAIQELDYSELVKKIMEKEISKQGEEK